MNEYVKTSVHALLRDRRAGTTSVVDAIDGIFPIERTSGPMQAEVIEPLLAAGREIARLREGRLGPLTVEQREALNVVHGRLSHAALVLRQLHEGTSLATGKTAVEKLFAS